MNNPDTDTCRLPSRAGRARLVVCESSGRWTAGLARELPDAVSIHRTLDFAECRRVLADAPASFAVVELTGENAGALLGWMPRLERELPLCRVAVVAERKLADHEWLLREAGAVHFTCRCRELRPLARAASRHLDRAPVQRQDLVERIWDLLPWGE